MAELTCAIAESRIKPRAETPVLTLFVPTYNRVPEMVQTVECLAGQLTGGLEDKVEILVSDNASGPEGLEAIRALADRFGTISYVVNAVNEGSFFQIYASPWRARGVWNWVFGSDDLMEAGGIAAVVRHLETKDPDFLTMDRQLWDRTLMRQLYARTSGIPERTFQGMIELFKGTGLHQVGFMSGSLEKTEAGRRIDSARYMAVPTQHNYAIAYFEKHQHSKCLYVPEPHIIRRLDNSSLSDYMGVVFEDVGMLFPVLLSDLAKPFGFTNDVFEQVNGSRFIDSYDPPKITLVDNIYEYQLRSIAVGRPISVFHKAAFEQMSLDWRPHRRAQFDSIWALSEKLRRATEGINEARIRYEQLVVEASAEREETKKLALAFTDKKPA